MIKVRRAIIGCGGAIIAYYGIYWGIYSLYWKYKLKENKIIFWQSLMKTLDLHNIQHEAAESLVYNFVMANIDHMPVRIITGKSTYMQNIVIQAINEAKFGYHYDMFENWGSLIITEHKWQTNF